MFDLKSANIGIIGLGYVGLPLAVEFGKRYPTTGLDIDRDRIRELKAGNDVTREVEAHELEQAERLKFTSEPEDLAACSVYIVTVPTPVDRYKNPDLTLLRNASEIVGRLLRTGDVVVYESTVYPGATEEVCVPILEAISGLGFNRDFFVGYSPERINPGDSEHRVANILKVTS
ncbi:MAG: Vi polysaccharide biosynthesis UDP-N-acetylglucosamine C-6 dehydrogenase TviB, partial [Gammaproteobacteria bacterium]